MTYLKKEMNNKNRIESLFTRDGNYHFSRWSKSIAPVVFGVDNATLTYIKIAFEKVVSLTPILIDELDSELGANFLIFFCSEWAELRDVPNLPMLIPNFTNLLKTLEEENSNKYRNFSFTSDGSINLCVLLMKYDSDLASVSVQTLATSQMLQTILLWSPEAFKTESPVAIIASNNMCVVKPFYSALIEVAYDPVLPNHSSDRAHALRLQARLELLLEKS